MRARLGAAAQQEKNQQHGNRNADQPEKYPADFAGIFFVRMKEGFHDG
jgi:hypothetical protein